MILLLLLFTSILLAFFVIDSLRYGIPPTPTSKKVRLEIEKHLPLKLEGKILDCGSGFGSLAYGLKKKYPGLCVEGYEASWIPFLCSKLIYGQLKPKVGFYKRNFMFEDLREYSLIFCYLYPKISSSLVEKFQKELKTGTWVISHTFALEGLSLVHFSRAKDLYHTPIYVYQI